MKLQEVNHQFNLSLTVSRKWIVNDGNSPQIECEQNINCDHNKQTNKYFQDSWISFDPVVHEWGEKVQAAKLQSEDFKVLSDQQYKHTIKISVICKFHNDKEW